MAAVHALRQLFRRMGVSQEAATYFTDVEEVDSVEEVANLRDEDVQRLCNVTRKPGGMMPNPNAGAC